jgi:hypothetical protein
MKHRDETPRPAPAAASDEDAAESGAVRPDEMPGELVEFLNAIDALRRAEQRPNPGPEDVCRVLAELGYRRRGRKPAVRTFGPEYARAIDEYKRRTKRLFPNWSEIHRVLVDLGWKRSAA